MKKANETTDKRRKALILWEKAAALYVVIINTKGFKIAIYAAKFVWLVIRIVFFLIGKK